MLYSYLHITLWIYFDCGYDIVQYLRFVVYVLYSISDSHTIPPPPRHVGIQGTRMNAQTKCIQVAYRKMNQSTSKRNRNCMVLFRTFPYITCCYFIFILLSQDCIKLTVSQVTTKPNALGKLIFNKKRNLCVHTTLTYHRITLVCPPKWALYNSLKKYSHSFYPQMRCQISLYEFQVYIFILYWLWTEGEIRD